MRGKLLALIVLTALTLVLIVLTISFVSALDDCAVTRRADCRETDGNYIVAGLSSDVNAHVEANPNGKYDYVLCCNFPGTRECTTGAVKNKIFGVSSETNAHVSAPNANGGYIQGVCYGDLVCRTETNIGENCYGNEYPIRTISISSNVNAHAAENTYYQTQICCKRATPIPTGSVFWADENNQKISTAQDRDIVRLFFNLQNLQFGQQITYEIWENDLVGDDLEKNGLYTVDEEDIQNGYAYITWTARWEADASGNPEYYFVVNTLGNNFRSLSPDLEVTQFPLGELQLTCEPRQGSADWVYFLSGTEDSRVSVNVDNCYDENYNLGCCPLGFACDETTDSCVGEDAGTIEFCGDYLDENSCLNFEQSVAENSVSRIYNGRNCEIGNNYLDPQTYLEDCKCAWEPGTQGNEFCKGQATIIEEGSNGNPPRDIGICTSQDNTLDTCADGFLTYSWIGTWTWHENNLGLDYVPSGETQDDYTQDIEGWHYNPVEEDGLRASEKCVGDEKTIQCSIGLQLPFFSFFNILISISSLIVFYYFVLKRNKK